MLRRLNLSGLVIAGIGFFLTRFTVTLAIYDDPFAFYLAGVTPLAIGLGLAAFGVALAVADVEAELVRTTAVWCVTGFVTMLLLVVLTLVGSDPEAPLDLTDVRSQTYLSNFLIGGSVGGTLTGLYAARNRMQRRALEGQANRLEVLNRILRHEILNAVTAIRGYAEDRPADPDDAMAVISDRSETIRRAVDEVKYLTRHSSGATHADETVSVATCIDRAVETVSQRHPEVSIAVDDVPESLAVGANDRLERVVIELLENAIRHGGDSTPRLTVSSDSDTVAIRISDDGPGLPTEQRALLERGAIEEFDDPTTGFGLNVVRLLVESYGGHIETTSSSDGASVTVTLPRSDAVATQSTPSRTDLAHVRPAFPHLVVAFVAAALAGVAYGIASAGLGGSIAAIGVFYGIEDVLVGWLTHEFHSVVFGFMYVGLLSMIVGAGRDSVWTYAAVGVAWGITVWFVAASFVAPIWLRLLGVPASVPNFAVDILVNHLVWGLTLGLLTYGGYRYGLPFLDAVGRRIVPMRGRSDVDPEASISEGVVDGSQTRR